MQCQVQTRSSKFSCGISCTAECFAECHGFYALQHAPVFNNQVLIHDHTHTATTMLFPGITRTADMKAASAPGIFQYRCDYQDHYVAGMQARLVVTS
jgi:hypothetical protein